MTLCAVALGLFALARHEGLAVARAQTTAVTGAVLLQALYLLACRSLTRPNRELGRWSNPSVYAGIAGVLALQALFVFAPFMHGLRIRPLGGPSSCGRGRPRVCRSPGPKSAGDGGARGPALRNRTLGRPSRRRPSPPLARWAPRAGRRRLVGGRSADRVGVAAAAHGIPDGVSRR